MRKEHQGDKWLSEARAARFAFNAVPASALPPASRDRTNLRNEYGFELRRIRMNFFGHVLDRSWTCRIQWSYERDGENSGRPLAFGDAFIQKALGGGAVARHEGLWVVSDNDKPTIANPLVSQSLNIVTLGANWYFHQNAAKLTLDGGWAMNPVRFGQGLFGQSVGGADWRASSTGNGVGEVVIRCQLQLLF